MLRIIAIVGVIAGLSWFASHVPGDVRLASVSWPWQDLHEQATSSYAMPANGVLQVSNSSGDIYVTAGDGSTVDVTVKKTGLSRSDLDAMSSHVDRTSAGISITTDYPHHCFNCDLSYDIRVPRNTRVVADVASGDVHVTGTTGLVNVTSSSGDVVLIDETGSINVNVSSGDVKLTNVSGAARVKESSGDISATGLNKDIDFGSASGDVDAEFASFDHVETVRIHTVSGSITLNVPRAFGARITANTRSGDLSSNMKLPIHEGDSESDLSVSVGSGTTSVDLAATSGDIKIDAR